MANSTSWRSIHLDEASMRIRASRSGTCLIATMIFMVLSGLGLRLCLRLFGSLRQLHGCYLCDVEQARGVVRGCERAPEHGVAERTCSTNCSCSGGYEFLRADGADALALLFAEEGEAAACSAA